MKGLSWIRALGCAAIVVATASCSDDNNVADGGATDGGLADGGTGDAGVTDGGTLPDGGTAATSRVRVLHASPDAPAIDLYPGGGTTPLITNLAYRQASAYLDVPSGTIRFDVRPAGAASSTTPVLTSPLLTLQPNESYTAIAAGLLAPPSGQQAAQGLRVVLLQDNFAAPAANQGRVRLFHATPDAPAVAVDLGHDGTFDVASLQPFAATESAGLPLAAGSPLQVALATTAPNKPVTSFSVPAITASSEQYWIVTGLLSAAPGSANGLVILPLTGAGAGAIIEQNPALLGLHAIGDAPAVDLFVDVSQVAAGLATGNLSSVISVAPGTYSIDLFPADASATRPAGTPVATLSTGALAAAQRKLLIAHGTLAANDGADVAGLVLEPALVPSATGGRFLFVNALPGVGAVSVVTVNNGSATPFGNVAYGQPSDASGAAFTTGAHPLAVRKAGSTSDLATFTLEATEKHVGVLVLFGTELEPRLAVIDTTAYPWTSKGLAPVAAP